MVKGKGGLPEGFDLKVSAEELTSRPARLPSYLDDSRKYFTPPVQAPITPPVAEPPVALRSEQRAEYVRPLPPPQAVPSAEPQQAVKTKRPRPRGKRAQMNLSNDSKDKLLELLELVESRSPEGNINNNDIVNALIYSLYEARDHIDVSQLPVRGRWGSPTAKSFPVALAQAFQEALVAYSQTKGINPFKRAVGA